MLIINAKIKLHQGKSINRRLRMLNKCPAIIYGGNKKPISIEFNYDDIITYQIKNNFYTEPLLIYINGKKNIVKIKAVQRHPFKQKLIHIDFLRFK